MLIMIPLYFLLFLFLPSQKYAHACRFFCLADEMETPFLLPRLQRKSPSRVQQFLSSIDWIECDGFNSNPIQMTYLDTK